MSEKPIAERLQVKRGRTLAVIGAPADLDRAIGALEARAGLDTADIVLMFVRNRAELDVDLPSVLGVIREETILWLAYPKLTSRLAGDLDRDIIRHMAPAIGLDPVSQIAIDADWSALRLKRLSPPR